jgi:FkbM family methyltransferase
VTTLPLTSRSDMEEFCRARATGIWVGHETLLCRILGRFPFYVDAEDRQIVPNLALDGFWEAWNTLAIARRVRPGWRVVDVGANHGYFTLLLADLVGPEGHVVAFEPMPRLFDLLSRNVEVSGFAARVTLVPAAAGARDGSAELAVDRHKSGEGSVVVRRAAAGAPRPVPMRRLDGAVGGPVHFMKVDAEGADYEVLEGARGLLDDGATSVLFEHHAAFYADPRGRLERLLADGFRLAHVNEEGEVLGIDLSEVDRQRDRFWSLWLTRGRGPE